jgi:plastocyanin
MAGSATFSHTFEEPGTYTYLCEIHPDQMLGTVVVEG